MKKVYCSDGKAEEREASIGDFFGTLFSTTESLVGTAALVQNLGIMCLGASLSSLYQTGSANFFKKVR